MNFNKNMFFYLVISSVLGLALSENDDMSSESLESRILYGSPADIQEYPFFAAMILYGQHSCGAAIISDRWLLTAAHCLYPGQQFIVGGNRINDSHLVAYDLVIPHPEYREYNLVNDIALIRLATRLQFTNKIQPIELSQSTKISSILLGLGRGQNELGVVSPTLMKVDLIVTDTSRCEALYLGNSIICVTRRPRTENICMGDSGGPLVAYNGSQPTLVGVTSFITNQNCHFSKYTGYTKVSHHVPWIYVMMTLFS